MKVKITCYLLPLFILTIIITFCSFSCSTPGLGDLTIEEPAQETAEEIIVEEPEPNIALEIVGLAKSQIGNLTGDGTFADMSPKEPWADSNYTYCDRFVSAVMTVASGKPLSERKGYPTAYDDYIAHEGLIKSGEPSKGAVVYLDKHAENTFEGVAYGRVGIYDGEGNIISVLDKTNGVSIVPLKNFRAPLLGWVTFKEYVEESALVDESLISTLSISLHPWPMPDHDAQRTSRSSFIGPAELPALKWVFESETSSGSSTEPIISADGTIYLRSIDRLYAVNPDGSLRWTFKLPEEDSSISGVPCISVDGIIYFASSANFASSGRDVNGTLYALNPDGTVKWKYNTGKYNIHQVLLGPRDTIFVSLIDEVERALYPRELLIISSDGRLRDSIIPPRQDMLSPGMSIGADGTLYSGYERLYAWSADGAVKWMYDVGKDIYYTPPVIGDDGTIYVIIGKSRLYAINPDGTFKWATIPLGIGLNPPAIGADGTVYVASCRDGVLYALNSEDGIPKWVYNLGAKVYHSPVIDGEGTIYVVGYRLYAINPDGTLKWSFVGKGLGYIPIIGTDGTIYSVNDCSELCAISD